MACDVQVAASTNQNVGYSGQGLGNGTRRYCTRGTSKCDGRYITDSAKLFGLNKGMQAAAAEARADLVRFNQEFENNMSAWENGLRSLQNGQWQAATEDTLRRWRGNVDALKEKSEMLEASDSKLADLERLVGTIAEEKMDLDNLKGKAATREEQADSLNPKSRPSPYTNILGLGRTFRASTRWTIWILSIVFGLLALGVLGFLIWQIVTNTTPQSPLASFMGGKRLV